jgi:hypothetical protein
LLLFKATIRTKAEHKNNLLTDPLIAQVEVIKAKTKNIKI